MHVRMKQKKIIYIQHNLTNVSNYERNSKHSKIMNVNAIQAAQFSLVKATEYTTSENYGRAFAHYILCLELNGNNRTTFEDNFIHVTSSWCNLLEQRKEVQNARYCYTQALRYFPDNVQLLNYYAAHYARYNETRLAIKYFQIAHALQPEHLSSEKNLQSLYASKVPQWHFKMLNDKCRNEVYKLAIESTLKQIPKDEAYYIVDIGTGSGLLSLFATSCSQKLALKNVNIVAIEECEIMADIAHRIFSSNKMNVQLIQRMSTEISHERIYNLLITEIFDCCLFGEGVLSTLIHAHKELLKQNAVVIPHAAKLFIFGIECIELDKKYRYCNNNKITGFKLPCCIRKIHEEPYDAFSINLYDYKQITDVKEVVTVNFNDVAQLLDIFHNKDAFSELKLDVINDGVCHAFVICFELLLDPNNEYKICTNPLETENICVCWEQGLIFLKHSEVVQKTDLLKLHVSATHDKLQINYKNINLSSDSCECQEVSPEAIALLNFEDLLCTYETIINNFDMATCPIITILELSALPIFSILLLKKAKLVDQIDQVKVTCMINKKDVQFLRKVLALNEINDDRITLFIDSDIFQVLESDTKYNYIIYEPILDNGLLNEAFYSNLELFRKSLSVNGKFLPTEVNLCYECVESKYLEECTEALDENLFQFAIAKKINEYSVNEMRSLSGNFVRKSLSEIVKTPIVMHENLHETNMSVNIISEGLCNGFLYWFDCHYDNYIVSTKNCSYNRGAFVLRQDDKIHVLDKSCIQVKVKQDYGLLKIYM